MGKKWTYINTSNESIERWGSLCPKNEWRIVSPATLIGSLPQALLDKCDSVFVAGTECSTGTTYYMANCMRVDSKGTAIDQEPWGLAFVGSNSTGSGCIVHHGTWTNRTQRPPEDFWEHWFGSRLGNYYPFSELPEGTQGNLEDLCIRSQIDAFSSVINKIKNSFNE